MCGIVGILGREPVAGALVDALKRLEYRGYDSAGVATLEAGQLARRRAEGKLRNLETRLAREPLNGTSGITNTVNDIQLSQGSSSQFGAIKVDGTSIIATTGVISTNGARVLLNTLTASGSASGTSGKEGIVRTRGKRVIVPCAGRLK